MAAPEPLNSISALKPPASKARSSTSLSPSISQSPCPPKAGSPGVPMRAFIGWELVRGPRGVVTVRFSERPDETALRAVLETLMRDKAVACGEIWRAADPLEFPISMEERLRGGDRKIEACLLVEALRVPDAERIAAALASDFQRTTIGVYRLLCDIAPA